MYIGPSYALAKKNSIPGQQMLQTTSLALELSICTLDLS